LFDQLRGGNQKKIKKNEKNSKKTNDQKIRPFCDKKNCPSMAALPQPLCGWKKGFSKGFRAANGHNTTLSNNHRLAKPEATP